MELCQSKDLIKDLRVGWLGCLFTNKKAYWAYWVILDKNLMRPIVPPPGSLSHTTGVSEIQHVFSGALLEAESSQPIKVRVKKKLKM